MNGNNLLGDAYQTIKLTSFTILCPIYTSKHNTIKSPPEDSVSKPKPDGHTNP
jgi:hypothetical protein